MRLNKRTRELAPNPCLPLHQFPSRLRFTFTLVHVGRKRRNFVHSSVQGIIERINGRRRTARELFKLTRCQIKDELDIGIAYQQTVPRDSLHR